MKKCMRAVFSTLAFVLLDATGGRCMGQGVGNSPSLGVEDVMALLGASYAKIRIVGKPGEAVLVSVVDVQAKSKGQMKTLKLGPSGKGDLCLLTDNSGNIVGRNDVIRIAYTWTTPPFFERGNLSTRKFWEFRKGATFTDSFSEDSFASSQIIWNVSENEKCEITRIWWSAKEIPVVDAPGDAEQVGAVVLQSVVNP